MATATHVLEKLRSSDGRIRVKTLSGVSALVAVIALLVGVLPVFASHPESGVSPEVINQGGGFGKCSVVDEGHLPSAAGNEFHINNPTPGEHTSADGLITIEVYDLPEGRVFDFDVNGDSVVVYDVVVNGGPKSNHYDYDAEVTGPVSDADALHAPAKNRNSLHNLSHINVCYDEPGKVLFACDESITLTEPTGLFRIAEVTIFANSVVEQCEDKRASFSIDNSEPPTVTLAFEGDGTEVVAGRLDVTKDFGNPGLFVPLRYDGPGTFVDVQWCNLRDKATGDGTEFDDVLDNKYPSLLGVDDDGGDPAISCKVYEEEDASGIQYTVVYFELEDPQWR